VLNGLLTARLGLAPNRTLRLRDAHGATLRPVHGTLWITIDHDPRDIVLEVGEHFVVDVDQSVIVTALGGCAEFDVRGGRQPPAGGQPSAWTSWVRTLARPPGRRPVWRTSEQRSAAIAA
jgi:hypothetical protein